MNLKRTALSTVGAQIVRTGITVISGPVMARLIGPAPYGILAPAQSVGMLGRLLADSGFAYHTVTDPDVTPEQTKHLHRQSLALAGILCPLAFVLAYLPGEALVGARIFRGLFAVATVLLAGMVAVPNAFAQRKGYVAQIEWAGALAQAFTTFVVALPLAYYGAKLAGASLNILFPSVIAVVYAVGITRMTRIRPTPHRLDAGYRMGTLSANIGAYIAGNVDTLILATYLSTADLGVYSRANTLAMLPGTIVAASLSKIGMVSMSSSGKWEDQARFLRKATLITILAFSCLIVLALVGVDITGIAFGKKFSTPPSGFALQLCVHVFFFSGSLLNTYLTVVKRLWTVGVSVTLQGISSGVLFIAFRPHALSGIALALLIPAAVRYFAVLVAITIARPKEARQ